MCGIAGYRGPDEIPGDRLQACLALMRRRGPDAAAYHRHRGADGVQTILLHSRLSIIDLDARANQPLRFGKKLLVVNGELYNYVELRKQLEERGSPPFGTTSDSEVLLRVLAEDGWRGLARGEGMWSFALLDEHDGSLVLGRDRFGEKPLYLYREGEEVYFGSEIKFIAALLGHRLPVDVDHLTRYMINGYKSLYKQRATFFVGMGEIEPGSVAIFGPGRTDTRHRYWQPDLTRRDEAMSYDDAVAQTRAALIRSVELRLRADVPLAFCLSGGVDSNALIAIAKRVFGYNVHGFTIMNTDERYEERAMVEHSVAALGLRHTAIDLATDGFLDKLRVLVRQHDAPVYTITYYVQWQLMQRVAEHGYRISISGTGADELFSGYYDHHNAYLHDIRDDVALHDEALGHWREHVAPIVRNPYLQDAGVFVKDPALRDHIYLNADDFAGYLCREWREEFAEQSYTAGLLRNRMMNELFHESVPPILHEDDLNAMYYSIENRSPFLDTALFETCARIPTRHLIRRGRAKAVLRDAVRGIAPDLVIDNPRKVGFNAPIADLLDTQDPETRAYLLDDSPIFEHLRRDRIATLIDKAHLPNSESKFLFYFLNAKIFLEAFAA
jgi:asparagine synthase (glutamine-hydrolysing)